MSELFRSPFFGITLTVAAYALGMKLQKKSGLVICNGLVLAALMIIALLTVFHIPYEDYYVGGSMVNLFLSPATVCVAMSVYAKRDVLKRNLVPVLVGCTVGAAASVLSVWVLCRAFGLDKALTASLLPKSVTTPIATAVSEGHGGIVPITVAAVIVTGILGNLASPLLIRLFRIKDPMAAGLGIGTCSHALGTAKALELGETEGAMSGLAIGISGIFTALLALGFEFVV